MFGKWQMWEIPLGTGFLKPQIESLLEDFSLILIRKSPYKKVWLVHTQSHPKKPVDLLQQDCELLDSNEASGRFMSCSLFPIAFQ